MADPVVLSSQGPAELVRALQAVGYTVVGPTLIDGAIGLAELACPDDLAVGWGVDAEAGRYRAVRRADGAVFAHSAGPQSWKAFLRPARRRLVSIRRTPDGFDVTGDEEPPPRYAFVGVRPCDLAAIGILDRVLAAGQTPDHGYTSRRHGVFVVAVNCTEPGSTCFCVSVGGGPRARTGYDLVLTERLDSNGHRFLAEPASPAGERLLATLPHRKAAAADLEVAAGDLDAAADRMGRAMPPVDLRQLLAAGRESPHWADVGQRCLACANCTMVCPTCFCTTTEDVTDLTGDHAERWERWDSCFNADFSYLHGTGPVRADRASRYRHWITHKLSTWHDQFGGSGCVGCGRCIAWCPAGIDITAEASMLAELADLAELAGQAELAELLEVAADPDVTSTAPASGGGRPDAAR